ncbi:MAG: arylsulfatase [Bryobacterales bacterium]|nr:arylsulfatase [Bryobacterales bacterium]
MQRLAFLLLVFAAIASAQKPNIVFILADDMGFGDVQALNPRSTIPTPNLNRLSREGMTFVDAHTGSAVCTPTRYGLVTGRYSWRGSLKKGVLNGYGKPLIEQGRETIGSFLKSQGYYTGIVGKWHLGLGFVRKSNEEDIDFTQGLTDGPHTRGFDFSFIIPASLDFPPYVFIRNGQITRNVTLQSATAFPGFLRNGPKGRDLNPEDALDDLTAEATAYIHERAEHDQPFLLYFPLTAPHKPALPHKRFVGATKLGPYGDFVHQVDWTVGEVLNALDSAGVADNTVVFYSSDNGSYMYHLAAGEKDHVTDATVQGFDETHHTSNSVFRGTKADIWEAGHHVPFFVRWPGKVQAGSRTDETICLTDFFATAAAIVGAALPNDAAEDSFSLLPLMTGKPGWKRAPVIHHSANGVFAIREGKWKLVAGNGSGGREKPLGEPFAKPYQLYDLSEDIGERNDLLSKTPDTAKRLEAALQRLIDSGRSR